MLITFSWWGVWAMVAGKIFSLARRDWRKATDAGDRDDQIAILLTGGCFAVILAAAAAAIAIWG